MAPQNGPWSNKNLKKKKRTDVLRRLRRSSDHIIKAIKLDFFIYTHLIKFSEYKWIFWLPYNVLKIGNIISYIPHFMFPDDLQFEVDTVETWWFPFEHIHATPTHIFL